MDQTRRQKNIGIPGRLLLLAAILVAVSPLLSCRRSRQTLLRYSFRPGDRLVYDLVVDGQGTVTMKGPDRDGKPDEIDLPVRLEGTLELVMEVRSVDSTGVAAVDVSYRGFNFSVNNQIRGRTLKLVMTEKGMETWEDGRLLKEVTPEDDEFLLRGLAGETFPLKIDPRGKVVSVTTPTAFLNAFPYINFSDVLEYAQPELPENAVEIGTAWNRQVEILLPQLTERFSSGDHFNLTMEYTLAGVEGRPPAQTALLEVIGDIVQEEKSEGGAAGRGKLKSFTQNTSGEVRFDISRGRLLSSNLVMEQTLLMNMDLSHTVISAGFEAGVVFTIHFRMNLRNEGTTGS